MSDVYYEDFEEGAVYECGSYTITEDEIIRFATQWDPQPFHVDPERAADSPFGGLIASGWHTVGICTRLVIDELYGDGGALGAPGIEELSWETPVRPGDTLSAKAEVTEKRPLESRPEAGLVKLRKELYKPSDERVLTFVVPVFFQRRE
jgi:acyl dehydratase